MLLNLLVVLVVLGVLLWAFNSFVTAIDPRFKMAINVIVCLAAFLYIVSALTGRHFLGF